MAIAHAISCIHFDTLIDVIYTRAFDVRVLVLAPGSLCLYQDLEIFMEVLRWIYCRSATSDKAPGWSSIVQCSSAVLPGKSLRLTAFGRVLQNRERLKKPQCFELYFTCQIESE